MKELSELKHTADHAMAGLNADDVLKRRILHAATENPFCRVDQLRHTADRALAGLNADDTLKYRILHAAKEKPASRFNVRRALVPVMSLALVLVLGITLLPGRDVISLDAAMLQTNRSTRKLISSHSAGEAADMEENADYGVMMVADSGLEGATVKSAQAPAFRSIWAKEGTPFAMVAVDGRYYRMLTTPGSVKNSLLGAGVGEIGERVEDASVSGSGCYSNVCEAGSTVYGIKGMSGTLVACEVNGTMRVFQRVSMNGSAVLGGERLADTLQLKGHVSSLALSGVGTVTDTAEAERLFGILCANASMDSAGSLKSDQALTITLDNGLSVQLTVKNDRLGACGTWSCPDFFAAFDAAMNN